MTLPDIKFQTNFTERPFAGKRRASDGSVMLDINNDSLLSMFAILQAAVDGTTTALKTIDYVHSEIHGGSHFYIQGFLELNNAGTYYVKLVTPNTTKWSHFVFGIKSTGICTAYFDEDATGGMAGGSAVTPINNDRNSATVSGMTLTGGVTACTGYTTRLESDKWGTDGFKEIVGGGGGRENELILKQNTVYCRSFISGADNNIIQFRASWYEHTNK